MKDLDKIYIRANVQGKWDSFSISQLIKLEEYKQIQSWIFLKVISLVGISEGEKIKPKHITKAIKLLEKLGIRIVRWNSNPSRGEIVNK
jgi:hypothetical protein